MINIIIINNNNRGLDEIPIPLCYCKGKNELILYIFNLRTNII